MSGTLPLVHTSHLPCGCRIDWYAGEAAPGMWTKIDQVTMCATHEESYNNERLKQQEL